MLCVSTAHAYSLLLGGGIEKCRSLLAATQSVGLERQVTGPRTPAPPPQSGPGNYGLRPSPAPVTGTSLLVQLPGSWDCHGGPELVLQVASCRSLWGQRPPMHVCSLHAGWLAPKAS